MTVEVVKTAELAEEELSDDEAALSVDPLLSSAALLPVELLFPAVLPSAVDELLLPAALLSSAALLPADELLPAVVFSDAELLFAELTGVLHPVSSSPVINRNDSKHANFFLMN
jgi:hypothetical protein